MLRLLKKLRRNERGNVLILTGFALPLIIGSAGLAVDTVQWALWKRQLQRAADSAALAGVYASVQANATENVTQAVANDLTKHQATGYDLKSGFPQVTFPTGTGWANGVRVALQIEREPHFSSMFLPTINVSAAATAATVRTGVYCVVSLINTGSTGITATGSSNINLGCGMITNSTSLTAAIATGNSRVFGSPIAAVGAVPPSTNWGNAELLPFTVQQDDPFANLTIPSFSHSSPCVNMTVGNGDVVDRSTDTGVHCFNNLTVRGEITLGSATYLINGGDVNANSGSRLSCTGCTIILTNSSTASNATIGDVDLNGGARINMSAPTSGTYNGLLFYQDRRAVPSNSAVNKINGNSGSTLSGAMYFPRQHLQVNGSAGLTYTCGEFVAWTVEFSGDGALNNSCTAGYGTDAIMGRHVRLVA